jgi:hypothetical protein
MSNPERANDLTRLLHDGDPLTRDPALTVADRVEMRRTVLSQVPEQSKSLWHQLSPALGVAVLLAVALALAWQRPSIDSPLTTSEPFGEAATSVTPSSPNPGIQRAGGTLDNRKIQFETPGGTLVIWVLDPNFPS